MTAIISEAERHRRAEIIRDSQAALQDGETLDDRRECRQSELEQRRLAEAADASECASLRAELQALRVRVELTERRHAELTAIREALAESIDEAFDQVVTLNKRLQTELCNLVETRLGALQARIDGVLPDTKSALQSRARADEVSDLPNPLPPRRTIN